LYNTILVTWQELSAGRVVVEWAGASMEATGGIERMIKAAKSSGSLNISNRGLT
jgi:hypothetical protein